MLDTNPEEPKKMRTYSNLKLGGFIMKAKDCKGRLDKRQARITAAREQDDNDDEDDNEGETEKEQLERETRQLQSEVEKNQKSSGKGQGSRGKRKSTTIQ